MKFFITFTSIQTNKKFRYRRRIHELRPESYGLKLKTLKIAVTHYNVRLLLIH